MSLITHWLNTSLHVWRKTQVADGAGGFTVSYVDQGTVDCKVDQSTPQERVAAAQAGAEHTHNIYLEPDADVQRNDRLAANGVNPNTAKGYYEVDGTTTPSTPRYLKAISIRVEAG
jgi:SPP1 family predicted phage head-tail adaptor